jgi:hypothetical protein
MSDLSSDCETLIAALGAPSDPNANDALALVLHALHDEAVELGDEGPEIKLACRMEALIAFVEKYLAVSWSAAALKAVAPAQPEASETQNATPPVGKNELN